MATYNEIHPGNVNGENHNALYMIVGIILALVIAGFAFYYYNDNNTSAYQDSSAGTVVERVIEPSNGSGSTNGSAETENPATETNSMTLKNDNGSVTTSTSRTSTY